MAQLVSMFLIGSWREIGPHRQSQDGGEINHGKTIGVLTGDFSSGRLANRPPQAVEGRRNAAPARSGIYIVVLLFKRPCPPGDTRRMAPEAYSYRNATIGSTLVARRAGI